MDFIFDAQGSLGDDAVYYWRNFMLSAMRGTKTDFTPYIGKRPKFEDEKEFLPLQAADLYAWQLRRNIADNQGEIIVLPRIPLAMLNHISPIGCDLGENQIRLLGDSLKAFAKKFAQDNPHTPLLGPGEGKSETFRKSAKKAATRRVNPTSPSTSDPASESEAPC